MAVRQIVAIAVILVVVIATECGTHAPKEYMVTVFTSNIKNAGTDAKVQIMICGSRGDTRYRTLDDKSNNFEQGKTDTFKITAYDIGDIEAIQIKLFNTITLGGDWHVEGVLVSQGQEEEYFPVDMWLKPGQQIKVLPGAAPK